MEGKIINGLKMDLIFGDEISQKRYENELEKMGTIIENQLKSTLNFVDSEVSIEKIFCERVDGYIPSSSNKGGFYSSGFVLSIESAVDNCTDEIANQKMNEMYNDSYESVMSDFFNEVKNEYKLDSINDLKELLKNNEDLLESFNVQLNEYNEDDAVRFQVRVLYSGFENEEFSFFVSSQVNWEMPYFRDGKGCSSYIEQELIVKNSNELATLLPSAINAVNKLFK